MRALGRALQEVAELQACRRLARKRLCSFTKAEIRDETIEACTDDAHRYKDKQTLQAHGSSAAFKAFNKQLGEEGLMRDKMTLKMLDEKAGFASRL